MPEMNISTIEEARSRVKDFFKFQGFEKKSVRTSMEYDRTDEGYFSFDVLKPFMCVVHVYTNGIVTEPNRELDQHSHDQFAEKRAA
ncbi:MAG: hypothetical protein COU47_02745 [Candidatus Niyogibacteria bacterium CG10_big_fil_rev_8_21_14_0_10_46_36]|uniref:Uncharacterized protein n=1 Tax=Candidatus Niyogibacteria bacterium CG10_big_fil_rev_8_21_14_0_10_46_36 TaxID=1974726 RepID=A0A2H0TD47_9BACT|nr:MAG: hypothetical protein COU47_02745 [Candidatus Niyogibacteria bacterium CG10_big_fil_rev_8_21_14_0_10_46_36]